ncbi:MAG: hypothetical protein WBR18_07300 [Anaerolineales bacterium]
MSPTFSVPLLKRIMGQLPLLPEVYESTRPGSPPSGGYRLPELAGALPLWKDAVSRAGRLAQPGTAKRVLLLGYLQWWVENTAALSLLLSRLGHQVTLAHLPYRHWWTPRAEFDVRRQRAYLRRLLAQLEPLVTAVDLLGVSPASLPAAYGAEIRSQSLLDVQYTLQREDVEPDANGEAGDLYRLRMQRNRMAARRLQTLIEPKPFDVIVVPNGSILEFGTAFRLAKSLEIPVTTYDFGEQRDRVWLAQGQEVMRLKTDALWSARGGIPLTPGEEADLEELYQARRGGEVWSTFARQWQAAESQGAQQARLSLGLDPDRPVVLLCTNVVGDSLALDRQVFTSGMAEWLERTVRFFADRPQAQLVVRVHPGELLGAGHPSVEIVKASVPEQPAHVKVVPPDSKINTYDLIELAHLGLVYTTTVGMEMAMSGVPVIVAGDAHYRDKGFTMDPESQTAFVEMLQNRLQEPPDQRLPEAQRQLARRYAYRFFFEYPFAYPWHVIHFWKDMQERPFLDLMTDGGLDPYLDTLDALTGDPIDWSKRGSVLKSIRVAS